MTDKIEKVSIVVSKGSLEGVYPALIMANGARAEGIEANLFFTYRRQSRTAPGHLGRRPARHLRGHDPLPRQQDGQARHPADP